MIGFLKNIFYHWPLAWLGAVIYRFPSREIFTIGITGTNGKTTTAELIAYILEKAGQKVAVSSSLRHGAAAMTMPGRFFLQRFLRKAVNDGCQTAVIEVTSQGIAQHRHRFINWGAAVFTNLSLEHIEAHGSFERYREAKIKFIGYAAGQRAKIFINKEDRNSRYFIGAVANPTLYGKSDLPSQLLGDFNKYNVAAAVAVARELGINEEIIKKAVAAFPGVPGRMEFVHSPTGEKPFAVVIDYAVTPDALENIYKTLKSYQLQPKKLICVFGACGGGRDRWKRPELGKIAARYGDEIILTNEDPYDEPAEKIIDQIAGGIYSDHSDAFGYSGRVYKIPDRRKAIEKAISLAQSGDVVIITGKGSERFIHLANGEKIPWSDKETALAIINKV